MPEPARPDIGTTDVCPQAARPRHGFNPGHDIGSTEVMAAGPDRCSTPVSSAAERAARRRAFADSWTKPQDRIDPREARAAELLAAIHPGHLARGRRRKRSA